METARFVCNNSLILVKEYYNALAKYQLNTVLPSDILKNYIGYYTIKKGDYDCYEMTPVCPDIMYKNENVLSKYDNGSFMQYLNKCNLDDMLNIMYLCMSASPPKFVIVLNKNEPASLKPPYKSIKYAMKFLTKCI